MNDVFDAIVLGIVQGLTEFLPVSSTGHLIIAERVLGRSSDDFGLPFDAAIHLGTLAAVLVYFRETVLNLARAWFASLFARNWQVTPDARLAWLLILGTVPAAIAGAALESAAEDALRSPALVAAMLIVFCVPLVVAERLGERARGIADAGGRDALLVGAAQAIALIPGVSRSGITITAGMLRGFRRAEAATFAFLLSGPIIAGAGGKQLLDILRDSDTTGPGVRVYLAGAVAAGIVGYAAVAFLLRYLRAGSLYPFVAYRIAIGVLVLGLVVTGVL